MTDTTPGGPPSVAEIAALTSRLRALSNAGAAADPAERARFLADKDALIERITGGQRADARTAAFANEAVAEVARARAEDGGYALVGPSARAWRTDPITRYPAEPASEAEHRALRGLLGREQLGTTEPTWTDGEIVCTVIPAADEPDTDDRELTDHAAVAELGLSGGEGPLIDAGPALTAEEAAQELALDGRSLDEARGMVQGYLDDVSERIGTSAHLWGLDEADLAAIRADPLDRAHTAVAVLDAVADDTADSATADSTTDTATTSAEADQADADGWSR